jgi:hypothetical protein
MLQGEGVENPVDYNSVVMLKEYKFKECQNKFQQLQWKE